MPAKSAKQFKLMAAVAHGAKPKFDGGPSEKVAKEFVNKTPSKKRSLFMSKKDSKSKSKMGGVDY